MTIDNELDEPRLLKTWY